MPLISVPFTNDSADNDTAPSILSALRSQLTEFLLLANAATANHNNNNHNNNNNGAGSSRNSSAAREERYGYLNAQTLVVGIIKSAFLARPLLGTRPL